MNRGIFISFEGIDGAGKSSHVQAVADAFAQAQRQVVLTREPGGTPLAEKLRDMVLHDSMDPLSEVLLMFAARRDHLQQVIEPALARGDVVVCDRFTDATFAYQGAGRGFDLNVLRQLELWVQALPSGGLRQPDLTLWFSLDPAIAAERLSNARVPDRFEAQPAAFFAKVHQGYSDRLQADSKRFARIDASASLEQVREQVMHVLHQRLNLQTPSGAPWHLGCKPPWKTCCPAPDTHGWSKVPQVWGSTSCLWRLPKAGYVQRPHRKALVANAPVATASLCGCMQIFGC